MDRNKKFKLQMLYYAITQLALLLGYVYTLYLFIVGDEDRFLISGIFLMLLCIVHLTSENIELKRARTIYQKHVDDEIIRKLQEKQENSKK